jgi:DNA polymerase-3 subunit delta'
VVKTGPSGGDPAHTPAFAAGDRDAAWAGVPPLPWLAPLLAETLVRQRAHALLLHAAAGAGALPFALALAQGWLCEAPPDRGALACGRCASCRLVQARLHPDLYVLLPEAQRQAFGWPLADDRPDADDGKRKPSRQIRIDEVRALNEWVARTTGRGRGKVALLHPAEALNVQSANALLKTVEEPPPGTRLVLTAGDPARLLPTLASRCQRVVLPRPARADALGWLERRGIADAGALLDAAAGLPLDAEALAAAGVTGAAWAALPAAVARSDRSVLAGWSPARAVDALHKLCHDALARTLGATPVYFPAASVPAGKSVDALLAWAAELRRVARHAEHPWNEALLLDALVGQGQGALKLGA